MTLFIRQSAVPRSAPLLAKPTFKLWPQPAGTIYFKILSLFRVTLELRENMTLGEDLYDKLFGTYQWPLPPENGRDDRYECKLSVDEHGDIDALCKINGKWQGGTVVE